MKSFSAVVALIFLFSSFAIADDRCSELLTKKTHKEALAEGILGSHAPFNQRPFQLEFLNENPNTSVFLGSEVDLPERKFILKVMPLGEALPDFYALRLIRELQSEIPNPISVVHSLILTPKIGTLASETQVLQKNSLAPGRTLFEILADDQVEEGRRFFLRARYLDWISQMHGVLKKRRFEVSRERLESRFFRNQNSFIESHPDAAEIQPVGLKARRLWDDEMRGREMEPLFQYLDRASRGLLERIRVDGGGISIIIKTDNIMVDDADNMVLFDPF